MSIRPVDLQVILPRSSEVGQANNTNASKTEVTNQHFASQLEKGMKQESQHVVSTEKTEHGAIDKDGSNKNSGGQSDGRRRKKKSDEAAKALREYKSSIIDIKI